MGQTELAFVAKVDVWKSAQPFGPDQPALPDCPRFEWTVVAGGLHRLCGDLESGWILDCVNRTLFAVDNHAHVVALWPVYDTNPAVDSLR